MIGVASSGRRFAPLARYLALGKDGRTPERVAWTDSRNLPTADPLTAAQIMQATAADNPKVRQPVYHVAISFDPRDHEKATAELMRQVADQLLRDLKLEAHQVLIVAHRDREHVHMHLMVNRVHPENTQAWDRWRDRETMQRSLREQERALGLTEVQGRLYQLPGQEMPERGAHTRGEVRQIARGETPFADLAQRRLNDLRQATTWVDLHSRLAAHNLWIERKGQGLVVTDGEREIKASRIGRDVSFKRLEERLGPFTPPERGVSRSAERTINDSPHRGNAVERAAAAVRQAEQATKLRDEAFRADETLAAERAKLERLEWWSGRTRTLSEELDRALRDVYRDPAAARQQFDALAKRDGWTAAIQTVTAQPETLGNLVLAEERARWGMRRLTDAAARDRIGEVMHCATELRNATERLIGVARSVTGSAAIDPENVARAITTTRERATAAEEIAQRARGSRALLPEDAMIQRHLRRLLRDLAPPELTRLYSLLTAPQRTVAQQVLRAARELLIEREGPAYR